MRLAGRAVWQAFPTFSGGVSGNTPCPRLKTKGPLSKLPSKLVDGVFEGSAAHEQQNRVEISLDRGQRLKLFSGISSRYRCIDADGIDPGLRDVMFVQ